MKINKSQVRYFLKVQYKNCYLTNRDKQMIIAIPRYNFNLKLVFLGIVYK
jgi:hypothetical protein